MMVPNGWKTVRLNHVAEFVTSGSRDWAQYYSDEGSKFIRMTNLPRDGIYLKLDDLKFVDVKSDSADGKRTSLQSGDILISITAELGKIGWVPDNLGEAYINQHTALVRLKPSKGDSKYVAYLLSSHTMNHRINRLNDSGAKAGLNLPTIRSIPLVMPPLPEQQKIAKILSTWDKAIATTEKFIATSQQQKKALMQQLLTGKKRLVNPDTGMVFEGDWEEVKLEQAVGKIYGGGTPSRNQSHYWKGDIPWVTVKDLTSTTITDAQEHITLKGLQESSANIVPAGTVIIATRMALGKAVVATCDVAINQDLKAISSSDRITSCFLHYWFLFKADHIDKMGTGSTVKGIQIAEIKSLPISLPCIQEQQKIASVLTAADKEIELLEAKLAYLKNEKKALMQQLLTGKKRVKVDTTEAA